MQRMKYKLLSTLVIAAPLLLNTGVTTTVHASSGKNSGCNSVSNNSRNNPGYNNSRNNPGRSNPNDDSKFNNQGYPDRINTYPIHQYTPTIIDTSCNYSFSDFKTKLDNLVTAGIITQNQETIILNLYYNNKITTGETFKAQLGALVAAGTITTSQEYSILNVFTGWGSNWKIPAPVKPTIPVSNVDTSTPTDYSFSDFKTNLDNLVAAGTITQDQETTILNLYYNGQITKISNFKTQLDILVTVGTITQNQEYSTLNAFTGWGSNWKIPAPVKPTVPVPSVDNSTTISNTSFSLEDIKTKLDNLVTSGTITQDQETTILNLFNKGALTTKNLKSQLDILVIIGILTQNQAVLIQH